MARHIACIASILIAWVASPVGAGVIDLVSVQDKGEVTIDAGYWTREFQSHMTVTLGSEWENPGTYHRDNRETLVWNLVGQVTLHFWNIYPAEIHVPQPPSSSTMIDFFAVMAVGEPGSLGPLPDGMTATSGTMYGSTGTGFDETVSSYGGWEQLPTSSAHDTSIVWDFSGFGTTIGNFYLFSVTLPYVEVIPEPATVIMLLAGLLAFARQRRM